LLIDGSFADYVVVEVDLAVPHDCGVAVLLAVERLHLQDEELG